MTTAKPARRRTRRDMREDSISCVGEHPSIRYVFRRGLRLFLAADPGRRSIHGSVRSGRSVDTRDRAGHSGVLLSRADCLGGVRVAPCTATTGLLDGLSKLRVDRRGARAGGAARGNLLFSIRSGSLAVGGRARSDVVDASFLGRRDRTHWRCASLALRRVRCSRLRRHVDAAGDAPAISPPRPRSTASHPG